MSEVQDRPDGATAESPVSPPVILDTRPATPEEVAWCEFFGGEARRTVEVCRDAAKVLLQAVGLLSAVYFGALSVGLRDGKTIATIAVSPICCWALALVLALVVLLPWEWRAHADRPARIKESFTTMGRHKRRVVIASGALVFLGTALLPVVMLVGMLK